MNIPNRLAAAFESVFAREPDAFADAPGRVNLIGEHTDYNGGFVLPTVIPQRTRTVIAVRQDRLVRAWSREASRGRRPEEYVLGQESRGRDWLDFVQGMTWALAESGRRLDGFDCLVESDVPLGSGLSSSAALEVSLLRALREAFGLVLDDLELALLGRRAENEFVGAPVGIMDQMASNLARDREALFLDTRTMSFERVALPADLDLAVVDSGIAHRHSAGDYRTRRAECERAAALLGVRELRDVDEGQSGRIDALPAPLNRRVRHVVTEDRRVLEAVEALKAGDLSRLGRLFHASHVSMRDDYEVSIPEIDRMVMLAEADPDVFGARLTGGGFGGSIVILARAGQAGAVASRLASRCQKEAGRKVGVLVPPNPSPSG